ncbi:FMN reductase [Sphingomonas naasensis]|uniref:NAD(P)H-dependent oxidoreductase n=1 Tax=Sphingomonas naasensis TaxID=1344951 RepID=A0A4S1WM69_9SPHN|nr:NADPH-dependent FMN reductase [Sphingomonas naasensis]NIJ22140.1 FMN reductase [Sphingomonas naasensis]TGX42196.1 NAD(P)H-dependent oxidoreductase [Sphingomonas naasensis]
MSAPHIVALGGTLRPESVTGRLLAAALDIAAARGARVTLLTGDAIAFPHYEPGNAERDPVIGRYLEALRTADAVIVGSPGYHGTLSGLVKTALDYVEQLRADERVYFDGLPVGLIATAGGWQAAVSTLQALRTITHSLRGWPTPMGLAINVAEPGDAIAQCQPQMAIMVDQIFAFLRR